MKNFPINPKTFSPKSARAPHPSYWLITINGHPHYVTGHDPYEHIPHIMSSLDATYPVTITVEKASTTITVSLDKA